MTRRLTQVGTVIGERRLLRGGDPEQAVTVTLGSPRRVKGTRDWRCPFRIAGLGLRRVEYGCGVDAIQALTSALEGIRAILDETGEPLSWDGVLDGQSGFQRLVPLLPDPVRSRRLERLLDRSLGAQVRAVARRFGPR